MYLTRTGIRSRSSIKASHIVKTLVKKVQRAVVRGDPRGPSTAPLAMRLREASLRMTAGTGNGKGKCEMKGLSTA
jgi:hypothetical protein